MLAAGFSALVLSLSGASGPALKALPSVVGTARAGSQITGSTGTWIGNGTLSYAYRWERCDALGNSCAPITGADRATYLLASADVGKVLGLVVTAKDSTGSVAADASLVGPIGAASSLADIGRPIVAGTAAVGSTLTVTAGTWTTAPAGITYSWLRCNAFGRACAAIPAAASSTYSPVAADLGHTLVARLQATVGTSSQVVLSIATAAVAAGSGTTTTTTTTPGPTAGARPAVSGTARVGQRLTGAVSGATAYQWYRCDAAGAHCSSIHGAVKSTYVAVAKDASRTIGLTVHVNGTPEYASLVGPVAAAAALAATAQPTLSGKAVQGQPLAITPGAWTQSSSSVTYAWQRCNANGRICAAITGATTATYVPVEADVGHALVGVVTVTAGGKSQSSYSVASDDVAAPPALAALARLTVTGTLKVGMQLAGATGEWQGSAPITFAFQWYRCDGSGAHCSSIHGATKPTYTLVPADAGKTIGFTVNAADATAAKRPAYASLAGPVGARTASLAPTAQPKVSMQGQTLTVDTGTWTVTPSSTTVQWERCNANGRICTVIADATSASYTLGSADAGHAILALVTAHAGAQTASALSVAANAD